MTFIILKDRINEGAFREEVNSGLSEDEETVPSNQRAFLTFLRGRFEAPSCSWEFSQTLAADPGSSHS